ncbi:MAG: rhodanese-related sulfurtransferase [Verrucomicrobiota bacterium]|nr:rhodanese-related sulfurtransferase [Verrucomicrobiota bacterium]
MEVSNTDRLWKIAAFYHFTEFSDFEAWADRLVEHGLSVGLRGTIILAQEGINSTCSGSVEAIDSTIELLRSDERFKSIEVKYSYADFCPFPKFKVKKKPEIVTFRQSGADPRSAVGEYLDPEEWNQLISDPEVVTIDTRNDYEVKVGKFQGSINPKTDDFSDFATFVDQQLIEHKEKKIAMYCTGGIRCERSTAYLKEKGFHHVYHLKGGILKYLESMPKKESLWEGDCFVFDYRVAVNHDLQPALWKIDPKSNMPEPMNPSEIEKIAERRRSGAIFKKPYTV